MTHCHAEQALQTSGQCEGVTGRGEDERVSTCKRCPAATTERLVCSGSLATTSLTF
jgi:hypothetical protein